MKSKAGKLWYLSQHPLIYTLSVAALAVCNRDHLSGNAKNDLLSAFLQKQKLLTSVLNNYKKKKKDTEKTKKDVEYNSSHLEWSCRKMVRWKNAPDILRKLQEAHKQHRIIQWSVVIMSMRCCKNLPLVYINWPKVKLVVIFGC